MRLGPAPLRRLRHRVLALWARSCVRWARCCHRDPTPQQDGGCGLGMLGPWVRISHMVVLGSSACVSLSAAVVFLGTSGLF